MRSPNILFIQVDQLSALSLACYGDPTCHAPTLDRLAVHGVLFENAYCNFPLCAPSRFSMASGRLCSAIGAFDNAAEFPAEIPTYAHYLRRFGYQTSLSGKMHFIGPDQYHGFERRLTADLYPADFSWVPHWGNEGKRDTNDPRSVRVSGVCERSVQIDFDEAVTHQAIQSLYDMARSADDRPFFMQVSYTHPHEPYLCKQEYWDIYEKREVPLPRVAALSEAEHDAHSIRLLKDFGMFGTTFKEEDILRARRAYYGAVSYIDSKIAELLAALRAVGMAENTAVVFTSDHGDMLGERGLWFKKHFYEKSLRVPLIIYAPWLKSQRIMELVSLVDLLPTFNALATGDSWTSTEAPLDGIDLTGLLNKGDAGINRTVYAEYLAEATPAPMFMIRRGKYKFISSSQDESLLFDLEDDASELENLAGRPEHNALITALQLEVARKWDERQLTHKIILSQKHRALIRSAMSSGEPIRWNHGEYPRQPVPWYRGEGDDGEIGYNEWAFDFLPSRDQ